MASLETLPAPLPLHITRHLADLKSLHALCLSCPLFAAVFAHYAAEVFEHLMNKCLAEEVIVELRAYIILRTQDQKNQGQLNQDLEALYSAAQEPLTPNTAASAIRHTLHVFGTLSTVCNSVFDTKLQRVYALPHRHFANRGSNQQPGNYRDDIHLQFERLYTLPPPSPPDWDEQQRLLRAIWRLKVWDALKNSSSVSESHPARERIPLGGVPIANSIPSAEFAAVGRVGGGVNECSLDEMIELSNSLSELIPRSRAITWEPLTPKPDLESEAQELAREVRSSHGYSFFNRPCQRLPYSPLRGADWAVIRRLGFGIWSTRRLRAMGYKSINRQQPGHRGPLIAQEGEDLGKRDVMFTWNCLYRTAAGESIQESGADMSQYPDDQ